MPLRTTLLSVGTFAALAATSLVAGNRAPAGAPAAPMPAAMPAAAAEASQAVDDAIGAAVIESIGHQFETADVVVQLGVVHVRPASIQDRAVSGEGRLQIDGSGSWIPFRFEGLYDTASTEVTAPRLELGGGDSAPLASASPIAASLDRQMRRALRSEFESQPVAWTTGAVNSVDLGRFVRVDGQGEVDFGPDGSTVAKVHGLYDRENARWVRVRYELGDEVAPPTLASL